MYPRVRFAVRSLVVVGFAGLCVWSTAGESHREAETSASLLRYEVPGGGAVFALSLKAGALPESGARDVAILVDTSASQTGGHREQGLNVLEACLNALSKSDRVRLYAVDTSVEPLMDEFAAPQSAQVQGALAALQKRVPLGATNLQGALETARAAFTDEDHARSIVYIGDGMSTARLVEWNGFRGLLKELRDAHIAVTSYAIGPRTDLQLLGILAEHTGGAVCVDALVDDRHTPADKLGEKLAQAVDATVFYPDSISVAPEVEKLLPGTVPPIRSDRETILLGKGRVGDKLSVQVSGDQGALSWTVKPAAAQPGNTFLSGLWQMAEQSQGLLVAVAGNELLNLARQEYEDQVQGMLALGRQAVAARDLKQAEQIAQAVRQIDPANVDAQTILNASQKVKTTKVALAKFAAEEPAPAAEEPAPAVEPESGGEPAPATVRSQDLLEQEQGLRAIRAERLRKEVFATIEAANRNASQDIDASLSELKRTLTAVISSTDIDPDIREKLRARAQDAIDRLQSTKSKIEAERIDRLQRSAAVRARELATEQLVQRDEQLAQMIEKVSALMAEGYIGNADAFEQAEQVSRAAFELAPYSGVTNAAIFDSEAAGQLDKAQRLRYTRYDRFLAALQEVEKSHIPFPDEPPILYPAPEVWQALTLRRKKWASVDLMKWNPIEEKIHSSLDKPTTVDFSETPLEDAIQFLKDYHDINIWIDRPTLTEEGVALDTPITLKLSGVSMRSILKLLLEPAQLTYLIEDEVMKITTATKAGDKLSTRVYPVGDLVVPIIQARMLQMMGGGMGGMGGGMMGGGMMNVADPVTPTDADEFNNDSIKNRKKKV